MRTNEEWMREALIEAEKARKVNEVPVGAVVVYQNELIARAHNLREHDQQASAHAELLAIRAASEVLHTWNLEDCDATCITERRTRKAAVSIHLCRSKP